MEQPLGVSCTTLDSDSLRWMKKRRGRGGSSKLTISETLARYMREIFDDLDINNVGYIDLPIMQAAIDYVEQYNGGRRLLGNADVKDMIGFLHKDPLKISFQDFCLILTYDVNNLLESSTDYNLEKIVETFLQFSNSIRRKGIIQHLGSGGTYRGDDLSKLQYFRSLFDLPHLQNDNIVKAIKKRVKNEKEKGNKRSTLLSIINSAGNGLLPGLTSFQSSSSSTINVYQPTRLPPIQQSSETKTSEKVKSSGLARERFPHIRSKRPGQLAPMDSKKF